MECSDSAQILQTAQTVLGVLAEWGVQSKVLLFPSIPLMWTPKMHPSECIFGVRRLSSTRKPETYPHGRLSAFCWPFSTILTLETHLQGCIFDVGWVSAGVYWLLPHLPPLPPPAIPSGFHLEANSKQFQSEPVRF